VKLEPGRHLSGFSLLTGIIDHVVTYVDADHREVGILQGGFDGPLPEPLPRPAPAPGREISLLWQGTAIACVIMRSWMVSRASSRSLSRSAQNRCWVALSLVGPVASS